MPRVAAIAAQRFWEDRKEQEEVRMLLLKSCPHCLQGDMIVVEGDDGVVVECLQCGYTADERAVWWWLRLPQTADVEGEDRAG